MIERVGVVGCGQMGAGIAESCARAGAAVIVYEVSDASLEAGQRRIDKSLARAVGANKLSAEGADAARERLLFTTELDALGECQLVVEAIVEDEQAKVELFAALDNALDAGTILASNTSSIPISRLADATNRPQAVLGMHFFNPVPVMPLVELIVCERTSEAIAREVEAFASQRLGKRVIHAPDRAGFIVNALLIPYLLDAIRMFAAGLASAADIDDAMKLGCAHPMGPLALSDFIGLDTVVLIGDVLHRDLGDSKFEPPALLRQLVAAGKFGRKSGTGFYGYTT